MPDTIDQIADLAKYVQESLDQIKLEHESEVYQLTASSDSFATQLEELSWEVQNTPAWEEWLETVAREVEGLMMDDVPPGVILVSLIKELRSHASLNTPSVTLLAV